MLLAGLSGYEMTAGTGAFILIEGVPAPGLPGRRLHGPRVHVRVAFWLLSKMATKERTGSERSAQEPDGSTVEEAASGDGSAERDPHRLRLLGAMVQAAGYGSYRSTTVADVIGPTHVSRKTFYSRFANKQECFLAAYDLVAARATESLEQAYREAEGWPDRVEAAIGALFDAAIENPAALRLATVEIGAAGEAGIERRERSISLYMRFISDAAKLAPGSGRISDAAARAIVGGIYWILCGGISKRDLKLVPELASWAACYYPTPRSLAASRSGWHDPSPGLLRGGRAPGTLAPHSTLLQRRGLAPGTHNASPSFVVHSQRERILDAVANLTAAKGYESLGVNDIAAEAAVSLRAFYRHFSDKEDALLVAYELGHARGLALVERAYASQADWRSGVGAGLAALLQFLASEPAFAHIALIDAITASARTAERSRAGVSDFTRMLIPGFEGAPEHVPEVTLEAIAGAIFELCLHHAVEGRIPQLPELTSEVTFIALAPFIGAEEAARVASTR
jgi:AcrR family transcriptional regulator